MNAADAYGNTPVHFSSEYGHADILCWILERNPLLCVKNHEGRTPIDVAFNQEILQVTPGAQERSSNRYFACVCVDFRELHQVPKDSAGSAEPRA